MDIMTFRSSVHTLLCKKPKEVQDRVHEKIERLCVILDTETLSRETVGTIILNVEDELNKENSK